MRHDEMGAGHANMFAKPNVRVLVGFLVAALCAGCADTSGLEREFADFNLEIARTREAATAVSGDWTEQSTFWLNEAERWRQAEGRLPKAAADFMESSVDDLSGVGKSLIEEFKKASGLAITQIGAEARLSVLYFDAKMKANLTAIAEALKKYEAELKTSGEVNEERFTQIVKGLADTIPLEPATGVAVPPDVRLIWNSPDKTTGFTIDTPQIMISGFGFDHPEMPTRLRVYLERGKESIDLSTDSTPACDVISRWALRIALNQDRLKELIGATHVAVKWDDVELHRVPLQWLRKPRDDEKQFTLLWSSDGKTIKSIRPAATWDFGIAPKYISIIRANAEEHKAAPAELIDLMSLGLQFDDRNILVVWEGDDISGRTHMADIKLIHSREEVPPPQLRVVDNIAVGELTYIPPHTRGDPEFSGEGPRVLAQAELRLNLETNLLEGRVYMKAVEWEDGQECDDFTTAEGMSPWTTIWRPDLGWYIATIISDTCTDADYIDSNHGDDTITFPAGELVHHFTFVGDTDSDDAGTRTKVTVSFHPLRVQIGDQRWKDQQAFQHPRSVSGIQGRWFNRGNRHQPCEVRITMSAENKQRLQFFNESSGDALGDFIEDFKLRTDWGEVPVDGAFRSIGWHAGPWQR